MNKGCECENSARRLSCTPQGDAVRQWGPPINHGEHLSGSGAQEYVFSCGFEVEAVDPSFASATISNWDRYLVARGVSGLNMVQCSTTH